MDAWFSNNGYGVEEASKDAYSALGEFQHSNDAAYNANYIAQTTYTAMRNLGDRLTTSRDIHLDIGV